MHLTADQLTGPEVTHLVLHKCRIQARRFLGEYAIDQMKFSHWTDHLANALVGCLETNLLESYKEEQRTENKHEISVPLTWWQHFKRDKMPKWFVDRWPVKYQKITSYVVNVTRRVHTCPHINHVTPEKDHLMFAMSVDHTWEKPSKN